MNRRQDNDTTTDEETATDFNPRLNAYPMAFETRLVEQFPTVGPSLVVAWFTDGSLIIEIGTDGGHYAFGLTDLTTASLDSGVTTIVRIEPLRG